MIFLCKKNHPAEGRKQFAVIICVFRSKIKKKEIKLTKNQLAQFVSGQDTHEHVDQDKLAGRVVLVSDHVRVLAVVVS